ncbi:hypothetical protein ABIB57_004379 [Devosia sp. UYZn731]
MKNILESSEKGMICISVAVVCQAKEPNGKGNRIALGGIQLLGRARGFSTGDRFAMFFDPPGELEVVEGMPEGGKIQQLEGVPSAFTPDYAPEEMYEIAAKLYQASR